MKKFLFILSLLLLFPTCFVSAAEPELTITGPQITYENKQFALAITADRDDLIQVTFTLTYDAEHLTFLGLGNDADWECTYDINRFTFTYRGSTGSRQLPSLRYKLGNVPENTSFWVMLSDVVVLSGEGEQRLKDIRWEKTVDQPLRTENRLAALTISSGTLSPAFSPDILNYTATAAYSVSIVDVAATVLDASAKIEIRNPELQPGRITEIQITVTAESGASRVYTIAVTREEAPPTTQPPQTEPTTGPTEPKPTQTTPTQPPATVPTQTAAETTAAPTQSVGTELPLVPTQTAVTVPTETQIPTDPPQQGSIDPDIPSWTYVVLGVAAVSGCSALGILLSDRKK